MKNVPNHSQAALWPSELVDHRHAVRRQRRRPAGVLPLAEPAGSPACRSEPGCSAA
jgi:hypothetical protein